MEANLGIFYTCYTEKNAVENSLKKLYEIYNNIPVYLVSDGGSDYEFLYEIFKNKKLKVKTETSSDRANIVVIDRTKNFYSIENKNIMLNIIKDFIRRIDEAIDFCNTKFMLIIEPDVLVRGKLNIPDDCILMTNNVNKVITPISRGLIKFFSKRKEAKIPKLYGMPIIFNTIEFKKIIKILNDEPDLLEQIYMIEPHFAYYDKMFEILFSLIGINGTKNNDVTECFRDKDWRTNGKPLIHQYREFYPSKEEHNSKYSSEGQNALTEAFKNNKV
jgi:hypothetical protein